MSLSLKKHSKQILEEEEEERGRRKEKCILKKCTGKCLQFCAEIFCKADGEIRQHGCDARKNKNINKIKSSKIIHP